MGIYTGILLLFMGIIAGGYGTIVGAGGGFIFVPALLIILDIEPVIAAGSGLVIVMISALTGVIGYTQQKKVNFSVSFFIGISAVPGALIGVLLLRIYSTQYFHIIFATILISLSIFLFIKNSGVGTRKHKTTEKNNNVPSKLWFIPLGLIMGIVSSYLGIGGGWLLVPILIYIFNLPTHKATATSILTLFIYSTVGVISQLYYNNVDWVIVAFGGIGVIIGAIIAVKISHKISGKLIIQMLSVLLVIIGVRMYF